MSLSELSTRELFLEASDSALAGAIMQDNESQRSYAAVLLQIARMLVVRLALESEHEEAEKLRAMTPCGARACTGCRVCGCPSLGIPPAGPDNEETRDG